MKNDKKFGNVFSFKKNKNKNSSENINDGRIDLRKISENEGNEKKTNVFKLFFKSSKASDSYLSTDERPTVDVGAKKISEKFNVAHNVLWVVLVAFVVIFIAFFSDSITTGSMQHMFRNMLGQGANEVDTEGFYFSVNDNAFYGAMSGIPVVVGKDRVVIFSPDGSHEYSAISEYNVPKTDISDKYMLVCDIDGTLYGVYDEFGLRHSDLTGNTITAGAIADDGTHVVARKGNEYTSEITVYTSKFETLNLIKKNNKVASLDIKADASEIMLLTYDVAPTGETESELMLLEKNSDSARKLLTFERGTPLECKYLQNGEIALLFDDSFCILNADGETISSYAIDVNEMYIYELSDSGALLYAERTATYSEDFMFTLVAKDGKGLKKEQYGMIARPVSLNMYGDYAYIITENSIVKLSASELKKIGVYESESRLYSLIMLSGKEYACHSGSIIRIDFKK